MARSAKPSFAGSNPARASNMKIAIVGAGFTGLAAAWDLSRAGHQVSLFEAASEPGGLAAGFRPPPWQWSLEYHYHHIFASDAAIINWVQELGLSDLLFFSRVRTAMRYAGEQFQLDSPLSLLQCPVISWSAKLRTATTLAGFKLFPLWRYLEARTTASFLRATMGEEAWRVLWAPLMEDKFGRYADQVNAAWFWARIQARTPQLGYFRGGFGHLASTIVTRLEREGVEVHLQATIDQVKPGQRDWQLHLGQKKLTFDSVLFTGSAALLTKLVPMLPTQFSNQIRQLRGLAARTLVLELERPFFADKTYWLSVNEASWPFLAVIEQTNLVDPVYYGGSHLLYVAKYLETSDELYRLSDSQLLAHYAPFLDQLSPGFRSTVRRSWSFAAPFAQPVPFLHQSRQLPPLATPLPGLYWASMQHVYPWDRGTNYAVQIGRRVARLIND